MASINPLEFFSIGQQIGATNSPVSGLAGAVRNVLDKAKSLGLLKAQSQFQGEQARDTALFKKGLEPQNKTVSFLGPKGIVDTMENVPAGQEFKSLPQPTLLNLFGDDTEQPAPANPLDRKNVDRDLTPEELKIIQALKQMGG